MNSNESAPEPTPKACGEFRNLERAILLPPLSYNLREKAVAIDGCTKICGVVRSFCCDMIGEGPMADSLT